MYVYAFSQVTYSQPGLKIVQILEIAKSEMEYRVELFNRYYLQIKILCNFASTCHQYNSYSLASHATL